MLFDSKGGQIIFWPPFNVKPFAKKTVLGGLGSE